ncbi:MAG: glycosyltransferase [Lachnospiraceae bacterium]|nr:glycosyltransferase [Lachnospiraceae bacterium]
MEKSKPEISIIVPVYKTEAYLEACVRSILAQTYSDWELILVDDGSPDRCGEICDRLAGEDPRIRVLHQENGGVSRARNAGLEAARGAWLAFVDSDDRIETEYLQFLYDLTLKHAVPMAACAYYEDTDPPRFPCRPLPKEKMTAAEFLNAALKESNGLCLSVWGCLIPAEYGIRFREDLAYSEDTLYFLTSLKKAGRIAYAAEPLYAYQIGREGNTVTRRTLQKHLNGLAVRREMSDLFAGEDPELDANMLRVRTDLTLQAVRQAAREKNGAEKKTLLREARALCRKAVREPLIRKKDRLRLALLSAAPVSGAALWEKIGGKNG